VGHDASCPLSSPRKREPSMFPHFFSYLRRASKTRLPETFRKNMKNIKNYPKKEGFFKLM